MRKNLSLLLVAFMAVAAFAVQQATKRAPATPNTVSWAVTSDNAPAVGTAFDVKNGDDAVLKVAFGAMNSSKDDAEATNYATGAANVSINFDGTDYAFGAYATTSATNGSSSSSLGANGESNANYMAITPKYDGQLVIVVQNQGNKTTYLFEDGQPKAATLIGNGSSNIEFSGEGDLKVVSGGESNYSGGILVDVKAGSLYTISVGGSKGRWMGLIYKYVVPVAWKDYEFTNFNFAEANVKCSSNSSTDGDITEETGNLVITDATSGVKLTVTPNASGTPNRFWKYNGAPQLRVYGGTMTFESLDETKFIHKLTFNNGKWNAGNTADTGEFTDNVWTGEAKKVVVTVAGNTQLNRIVAEVGEEQKFYLIGGADGAAWTLNEMPELKWNAEADAFEASVQFETEKAYYAISNVASAEDWDSFNANNRFAIAEGDQEAAIGEAIQLQKVNGTIVITGAGKYNLSLTRDLKLTISKAQKYYVTGTFNNWALTNMPEMTWNDETKAYEYVLTVAEETNFAISDVATVEGDNAFIAFNDHRYVLSNDDEDAKIGEAMPLALGKGSLILKEKGKYLLSLTEDMQLTVSKYYEDIALSVSAGEDISEAIAKEAEGKFVGGITLKLGPEQYTISKPIEPAGALTIDGNGAVIDASNLEGNGFINYQNVVGDFAMKNETEASAYILIKEVAISGIKVNGLTKSFINNASGKKTLFKNLTVENSVIEVSGSNNFFSLGTAYANNLTIEGTTIWSKDGHKGFFFKADGKPADVNGNETTTWTVNKCNLINIAVGKKANNSNGGIRGKKTTTMILTNSILVNFGSSKGSEVNGWLWGQNGGANSVYENNSYWSEIENGEFVETWTTKGGGDATGTAIKEEPIFADAENGDFTLGDCLQKLMNVGDPRWNNTTFGATAKLYNYLEEPQKGSMKVSVLGEDIELTEYGQSADVESGKTVIVEIAPAEGYRTKDVYLQGQSGSVLKVKDNKYAFAMTTSEALVCVDFLTVLKDEWIGQIANQQWTGEAIEPSLVVVDANTGVQLEAGKHYEASYANNVDAGEATVTITGIEKNGYAGTATAKFNIIKIASTELAEGNFIYRTDDNVTATILWMSANKGATTFEIPATIDGYQIVEIVDDAMQSIDGLKEINMPEGAPIQVSDKSFTPTYIHPSKTPVVNVTLENLDDYADMLPMFTKNYKVKATVKQTAEKFWTFSSGTAVLLPEGLKANIVRYKNDNEVEKVALGTQYVKAGQGVLLEGTQDTEYVITAVNEIPAAEAKNAANYEENLLIAVPAAFHFPAGEGYYILKNGEFFAVADTETEVPANKAVLQIVTGTPAAVIRIAGGEATGINTLAIDAQEGNWYDLNGRKLEGKPSQKGIYILNGKKVVLK